MGNDLVVNQQAAKKYIYIYRSVQQRDHTVALTISAQTEPHLGLVPLILGL